MPHTHTNHRRLKTLSIGGATYDVFLSIAGNFAKGESIVLKGGEKIPVERVIETCGGGACNTSIGLSRLGFDASYCGVLGADQRGTRLLETMQKEGVCTDSVTVVEHETSSFSIIVNLPSGERTILASPGTSTHLHDVTFDKHAIADADCVYLNHLCESACEIENDLIEMLTSAKNIHLTWNPGGCQIHAGMKDPIKGVLLARTNLLLLNKEEALAFSGAKDTKEALELLSEAGVKNVCITDGKNGVMATDGKKTYRCSAVPNVKIIDTTGAGDAFGIGATWALLIGKTLPEALIAGTLNATSVLGTVGAQSGLLTKEELAEKLKTHSLHVETVTD